MTKSTSKPKLTLGEEVLLTNDISLDAEAEDIMVTKPVQKKKPSKIELAELVEDTEPEVTKTVAPAQKPKGLTASELAEVESMFMDLNDLGTKLKMLVYGRSGSGKTHFAGTAPDVCFLAIEDGTRTLKNVQGFKGKVLRISSFDDFEKAYWMLQKNSYGFKTVAIDNLTRLVQLTLRHEVLETQKKSVVDEAVIQLTQRDYGNMTQRIIYWLSAMFALPLNFIVLCQERTSTDDADMAEFQSFPDMPRALRSFVLGDMDIVGRMYLKIADDGSGKVAFRMEVGPNEQSWTKDRTASFGQSVGNPTFDKIHKKFKGES